MPPYIDLENMPSASVAPAARPNSRHESGNGGGDANPWAVLLRDLADVGPIHIGTSLPAVTLEHHGNWPGARLKGAFGIASGRRFKLRMMLGRWSHLDMSRTDAADAGWRRRLFILDVQDAPLLELGFGEGRQGIALDALIERHNGCANPSRSEAASTLTENPEGFNGNALRRQMAELGESPGADDVAEATGQLRLSPARLREHGHVAAVDVELIPCFLEALAEQALPIRIATGTSGVAHSLDSTFFSYRREGSWQALRGDSSLFRIDAAKIDSAWVLNVSEGAREHTTLRLYNARGRSLATLGAAPGFVAAENPIWRTLVNALRD